ncbi:hypothetical protein Dimus_023973 [Dionaea muscipula]
MEENVEEIYVEGKKRGGWRAIKYILANETFEKLASMSLIANITVYLKTMYNMDGILLVNVVNIWSGSSNISSLGGALLSDVYLGRFYTLLIGSITSLVGMGMMTLTASVSHVRPPPCKENNIAASNSCYEPQGWQLGILFTALTLLALGSGCIRPCNIAFGADQFDTRTEKGRAQLQRFYNWWYFTFTIALLVALTAVVYIQTNISWVIGFAIPTGCFVLSIMAFLIGSHTYVYHEPRGSIFVDMVKVIVAACRNRSLTIHDHDTFYDPPNPNPNPFVTKLSRTDRLLFLDKAALISDELKEDGRCSINSWRLCSIQQVEQLKCLIGCLPVWIAGILSLLAMDQQNTFGILQAIQMNRKVGGKFIIPPAWIGLTSMVALSIWILIYERVLIPLLQKLKHNRISIKERIRIGIVMSIACMVAAGFVERQRRGEALKTGSFVSPLSVFALAPQLVLSGLIEAFAAVSIMEFFTTQMPESMRSIAGAVFFLSLSMASYLSSAIINIIHHTTTLTSRQHGGGGMPWLGGHDLNKNRLDNYYFIIAAVGGINLCYFSFFASNYILVGNINEEDKASRTLSGELTYSSIRS